MRATAQATARIAAPPERVYALIADITRMGEWSPETTSAAWVDGATRAEPGAWFEGTNKAGRTTWTTRCQIDVSEPGRELTFTVHAGGAPSSRWSYRLSPAADGGTDVVESMEGLRDRPLVARVLQRLATGVKDRSAHNAAGIQETLARLKAVAEA